MIIKKQCYEKLLIHLYTHCMYYQLTSLFCGLPNKPGFLIDILVWLCWGSGYPPRQWPGCWWSWWSTTVSIHSSPMILTGKQQRSGSKPQYFVWSRPGPEPQYFVWSRSRSEPQHFVWSRSGFEPQHFVWSRSNFSLRKWKNLTTIWYLF